MTILGKILAYVNVAVAVLLAAIAFALWANRIDLSNNKPTVRDDPTTGGLFAQREKELEEAGAGFPVAETALDNARKSLADEEQKRWDDRGWYLAEMQHLQGDVTLANPVKRVEYAAQDDAATKVRKGQVAVDPATGRPLLKDFKYKGNSLPSMAVAETDYAAILKKAEEIEERHGQQAFDAWFLTVKISGPPTDEEMKALPEALVARLAKVKLPGKGLIQRLADEQQKKEDVMDELKRLYPLLVNTKVDAQLVLHRNAALKARLKELQGANVSASE
jgi:hypothetical protein